MLQRVAAGIDDIKLKVRALSQDQSHPDADVQALQAAEARNAAALTAVAQEIADLKNQPGATALDFTALDAAVAQAGTQAGQLEGLEPPAGP